VHARAVDQADARLRELRQEERGELALAVAALAASLISTQVFPVLAAPLFIGGLVLGVLGLRALWRRWDLLERLSGERDAHVISEVRALAVREATLERRECFAALIRIKVREAELRSDARMLVVADELGALASELEDPDLRLDAAAGVACARLLSDVARSPLLNTALPAEDLRSRVCQIRSGLRRLDLSQPEPGAQVL
jgi:hypothetical protein